MAGAAEAAWWEPSAPSAPTVSVPTADLARSTYISPQQALLRESLVATRVPNLALLPAGAVPPNPAELLGSKRTADLLHELSLLADMVVIDTPPVLAVTDAVILSEQVDGVLLVASLGETKRSAAERAKSILSAGHGRLLGFVLNKVEPSESYYYGYYGEHDEERPSLSERDSRAKNGRSKSRKGLLKRH
jgi:capsular exopolysaccharide synthesis family protein